LEGSEIDDEEADSSLLIKISIYIKIIILQISRAEDLAFRSLKVYFRNIIQSPTNQSSLFHFHSWTPLLLTSNHDPPSLFQQLKWDKTLAGFSECIYTLSLSEIQI